MPQVLFRQIKAKVPNWQLFYNEIADTLDKVVKPDLIAWFDKVVSSWNRRPEFKAFKKITQTAMQVYVYPTGPSAQIWRYVSQGTRAHIIRPKNAKALSFKWGAPGSYKARTNTSGGYRGPGKATGTRRVFQIVHHPGNPPRNFEKHIARWYKPTFTRAMKGAVTRGLRKAKA